MENGKTQTFFEDHKRPEKAQGSLSPAGDKGLLGVIGGLGPMATAVFLERIVRFTDAATDQEHLDIVVRHCPSIPDRTDFILGRSPADPLPGLIAQARSLAQQGARCIAIPCITAHSFHDEIELGAGLPVIDTVALTAQELKNAGIRRAAVWATEGTMHTQLFQKALGRCGIEPILPDADVQKIVTDCIYRDIKTGRDPHAQELFSAREKMFSLGAQAIILGCTELSVASRSVDLGPGFIDALDVLARESIERCGFPVKESCRRLISVYRRD